MEHISGILRRVIADLERDAIITAEDEAARLQRQFDEAMEELQYQQNNR